MTADSTPEEEEEEEVAPVVAAAAARLTEPCWPNTGEVEKPRVDTGILYPSSSFELPVLGRNVKTTWTATDFFFF